MLVFDFIADELYPEMLKKLDFTDPKMKSDFTTNGKSTYYPFTSNVEGNFVEALRQTLDEFQTDVKFQIDYFSANRKALEDLRKSYELRFADPTPAVLQQMTDNISAIETKLSELVERYNLIEAAGQHIEKIMIPMYRSR